ncbi:MAG: peptidylprolyl isomerase [Bacteroidota bacterium]
MNTTPRAALPFLVVLLIVNRSPGQQQFGSEEERVRQQKIEEILRLKDLRTPYRNKLLALLSDGDNAVRREATLAYGTLQDTTVISLLVRNLTEADPLTQEAAAFAIGQTATMMSEQGREELAYDLIWKRFSLTTATARLLEEIGKFGTKSSLNDLILRFGTPSPVADQEHLIMCVARFAIRGVVSDDALRFLLRYVQPGVNTPWQVVYALQRAGFQRETQSHLDRLRRLYTHEDPLLRMNLAALLGRLRDSTGVSDVVLRLAEFDPDWRVRVNAFRVLGGFEWKGNTRVIDAFRRAFFDGNIHVRLTALSGFATAGVDSSDTTSAADEALRQLRTIAENRSGGFNWQTETEAALVLARVTGRMSWGWVDKLSRMQPKPRARLLAALSASREPDARRVLLDATCDTDPVVACAALDGLQSLVHRNPRDRDLRDTVAARGAGLLSSGHIATAATAASLLRDTLFRSQQWVAPLLSALAAMRPPHDTEAMQEIIGTLGAIGSSAAVEPLIALLGSPDPSLTLAAASALHDITGNDYGGRRQQRAEPLFVDLDFAYLRSLPSVVRVRFETARGDVFVDLFPRIAPFSVMSVLKLATQRGFYRGLVFHRVVANFVIQGGDPQGDGWGGPGYAIRSEFSMLTYETGTVGLASAGKDTEGSQFFITHSPQPHLDGRYTIIGKVTSGMEVVDRIEADDRMYDLTIVQ